MIKMVHFQDFVIGAEGARKNQLFVTVSRVLLLLNFSCIVPVEKDVGDVVRLQRRVGPRRNAFLVGLRRRGATL